MKSNSKKIVEEIPESGFQLPTLQQIDILLERELDRWKMMGLHGPYPMPILDFLIGRIGCEIELAQDTGEFEKDDKYSTPSWYADGITNGELFYSLYKTVLKMTEDADFGILDLDLCDQQAFASMLDSATTLFLECRDPSDPDQGWVDLWMLYLWCRRKSESPVWFSQDGNEVSPPELALFSQADWIKITEAVTEHFLGDSDVYDINMALLDQQPHWPTHQEFRKSVAWFKEWYDHTRWNSK